MRTIRLAAALSATIGMVACGHAARAETLILTTINATTHWSEVQGIAPFMACVKKATNGGVDFSYFPSGQIANSTNSLEALNKGLAQISFVNVSSVPERLPLTNITLLPGMGENVQQMVKAFRSAAEGDGPIAKEIAAAGVKPLIINIFPPYQMMARGEGQKKLSDFAGKKIRVAGGPQTFAISALSAVPVQIGFAEIYMAMQQGTVDAYMFSSIVVKDFSLQEVTKAMSRDGNFGTAAGMISISSKTFNALSADKQKALVDCGKVQEDHLAKYADETAAKLYDEFKAQGIDVYEFAPADKAAIAEKLKLAVTDYVTRVGKRGLPAQAALDEYLKALQQ